MIKRINLSLLSAIFVYAAVPIDTVFAADDWRPQLQSLPSDEYRSPTTPFEIRLPAEVSQEQLQQVALELDNIDVTRFIDNSRAPLYVFTPVQALSYGTHQLRLVEYTAEGDIIERGIWEVEVRKSRAFREASLSVNGDLSLISRIDDSGDAELQDRDAAVGSLVLDARAAEGGWRGSAYLPLLFNSASDERKGDIGDFLFSGSQGPVTVQVGHHAIPVNSLVADGFYSRGVSATVATEDQRLAMTGFAMHASPISGAQDGLGVGDPEDSVNGVVWSGFPLLTDEHYLNVSAVYVDGKGPGDGSGAVGDPAVFGGTAWSLIADAGWKHNRIRLRGEYAVSEYDFDGDGGFDPEKENATSMLLTYRPWEQMTVAGQSMDIVLNAEHRLIGPFFATPAGQSQAVDRDMQRVFLNFNWATLRIDASLSEESTNVDGNNLLPTDQTDVASVSLGYSPPPSDNPEHPYGAWGQQSYQVTLIQQKDKTKDLPVGYGASGIDSTTDTLTLGAVFNHQNWGWGVTYGVIRFDDATDFTPDTRDTNTELNAMFIIDDYFSLSPRIQVNQRKYMETDVDEYNQVVGMSLNYNPTRRWQTHLEFDLNRSEASDDSYNTEVKSISAGVAWIAIPAASNKPGVKLALEGSKVDTVDHINPDGTGKSYQIFFSVNAGLSALY